MPNRNNNDILVPQAASALDQFKYEVANEIGLNVNPQNYRQTLDNLKYEIANELGITPRIQNGYWGELTSRECGAVGGRIGGKIGGNMVKKMIEFAERNLVK